MLTKEAAAKALADAKASNSLTMGTSPFVTGVQFTISGYGYEQFDTVFYPVFETSLGSLSVSSLVKAKSVKPYTDPRTSEIVTTRRPEGTFNDFIRKFLADNRGKSNDEVLPLLVEACKDMKLVVRLREHITIESKYGDRPVALTHIDIVTAE